MINIFMSIASLVLLIYVTRTPPLATNFLSRKNPKLRIQWDVDWDAKPV
jgi:hypothetical protein